MTHPADLIMIAPVANFVTTYQSGKAPVGAAKAIDHRHGQKSKAVPTCLSTLASLR